MPEDALWLGVRHTTRHEAMRSLIDCGWTDACANTRAVAARYELGRKRVVSLGSRGVVGCSSGEQWGGPSRRARLQPCALSGVLAVVVIGIIGSAASSGSGTDDADKEPVAATTTPSDVPSNEPVDGASPSQDATPSEKPKPTKSAAPKPEPEPKALAVRALDIIKAFQNNELAADAKYKGQTLLITGVVDKIDTELFDDDKYILRLGGGGAWEILTLDCYDMSTAELATLKKGETVNVVGEFDDGGDLGVEVKNCSLAK